MGIKITLLIFDVPSFILYYRFPLFHLSLEKTYICICVCAHVCVCICTYIRIDTYTHTNMIFLKETLNIAVLSF